MTMPALAPLPRSPRSRAPHDPHDHDRPAGRTARRAPAGRTPAGRTATTRRTAGILATAFAASALLAGCAGTVGMEPAADATAPGCADVVVRLPDTAADVPRRETDAQGTGAWGDPASVLLRCGVEPYGPTTLPCDNVNGVDWIRDSSEDPIYTFTTYGRVPAIQVVVDSNAVSGTSALVDLGTAVSAVPQTDACLNADDVLGTPTPTPAP